MRVIAGSKKSLLLKAVPGLTTRPTTDRIKETLFNIVSPYIAGSRFLDIFAGSGGIGIEALSRGAVFCCFVEKNPAAVRVISENIKKTGFERESLIIKNDALKIDALLREEIPFDIVFADPPYDLGLEEKVIKKILKTNLVKADTMYVVEASLNTDFSWIDDAGLVCVRDKRYKNNKHVFLKKAGRDLTAEMEGYGDSGIYREL